MTCLEPFSHHGYFIINPMKPTVGWVFLKHQQFDAISVFTAGSGRLKMKRYHVNHSVQTTH
jgi:hypothetical protein